MTTEKLRKIIEQFIHDEFIDNPSLMKTATLILGVFIEWLDKRWYLLDDE